MVEGQETLWIFGFGIGYLCGSVNARSIMLIVTGLVIDLLQSHVDLCQLRANIQ